MDHATNALYAVLIVIFVVGTYGLALSLETILDQWERLRDGEWRPKRLTRRPEQGIELPSWRMGSPLKTRRAYKADEEGSSAA
jgi:hypothetical protein